MLAKKYRIHLKNDFNQIFNKGEYKHIHPYLTIHFLKEKKLKNNKYAFIYSKKQEKFAYKRNKILRQSRHIIQNFIKENKIKEKYFIILVLKKEFAKLNYQEKIKTVEKGLEKSKLMNQ